MKIFHIVSNKEWGGGEQYVYDLSQRQMADGIDVTIFCKPVEAIMQKYQEAGMKVIPLALGGALDVVSAWKMAKVIRSQESGVRSLILHAHNFKDAFTACYARCIARKKKVRVVMCRHLTRKGKNTLLYRWLYRHLDRLIFDSELSKSAFLSTQPTIDEKKLGIVHTSIVVTEIGDRSQESVVRSKYKIPEDCVIGMFHGRLDPEKGLDTLLEAVAQIKERHFQLVLVGRGSEEYTAHLKQTVQEKGIADKVVFAGRPVVVTNNGGQREYVVQEQNGLLVPPGDAKALAEAMARLVDDAALRQRLGQQAKADFDDHLNYDHYYEQIKKIYEE